MREAWRAYLELALGVTEASKKKAQKVAKRLVGKGGATASQLQALAEDVVSMSLTNREALTNLVKVEVDRALGAVGLAKADDVAALSARIRQLEGELREARAAAVTDPAAVAAPAGPAEKVERAAAESKAVTTPEAADGPAVAKKAVAKKAVAKKAVAKKAVAQKAVAAKNTAAAKKTSPRKTARKANPGSSAGRE